MAVFPMTSMPAPPTPSLPAQLDPWTCLANDAITLKFVVTREDIEDNVLAIHPEYTHQVVAPDQLVHGYKGLQVRLYYTPSASTCYLSVTYNERRPEALDLRKKIMAVLPECSPPLTNMDEFAKAVEEEHIDCKFTPPGSLVHEYTRQSQSSPDTTFVVYHGSIHDNLAARHYHSLIQPLIMWYIDNASLINVEEPGWRLFALFRKIPSSQPTKFSHQIVGFCTGYEYYHPWGKKRFRISQFMILPMFQRAGHATELLRAIYSYTRADSSFVDVTIEDASDDLTRVRDLLDLEDLKNAGLWPVLANIPKLDKVTFNNIRETLKLCWIQASRCQTVLRYMHATDVHDDAALREIRLRYKSVLYRTLRQTARKEDSDVAPQHIKIQLCDAWSTLEQDFKDIIEEIRKRL